MSRLFIKQKVFTMSEKFTVFSETEEPRYYVTGSFMQIPKRFTITDINNQPIAEITKTTFSWQPKFTVEMNGELVATIRKEFTFFKPKYTIDGAELHVAGDWWDMTFSVTAGPGGDEVAHIRRKRLTWADTYEVEVVDESLEAMIVSLVVAIDRVRSEEANAAVTAST